MYITIAGELGSGKSTVAKLIQDRYGFEIYSTGTVQREIAKEKGITTLELNLQMAQNPDNDYDKLIDNKTIEISRTSHDKDIIFDSRMAWHFVDHSFKVYVIVDNYVAAGRVILADRGKEEHYDTIDEAAAALRKRKSVEDSRFAEMYHVETTNFQNYNLVVDSSHMSPEGLCEFIMDKAKNHGDEKHVYLSPRRLYPTAPLTEGSDSDGPVEVVFREGYFHIVENHGTVHHALKNGEMLVHTQLVDKPCPPPNKELYFQWEQDHSFTFASYPEK